MNSLNTLDQSITPEKILTIFEEACDQGNVSQIEYLMSTSFTRHTNIQFIINLGVVLACSSGQLEVVKYLLNQKNLNLPDKIEYDTGAALQWASKDGHLNIVRYLLTDNNLDFKVDIHADDDCCLREACKEGQLEVVKYLLSSTDLKEYANIHSHSDCSFLWALQGKHYDILQFLIFELNIEKTPAIINHLLENPDNQIENWFNLRTIKHDLSEELSSNEISKRPKL